MFFNFIFFKVGDKIPSVDLFEDSPANKINTGDLTSNKKVIIFGVPGAFTPGCSKVSTNIYLAIVKKKKKIIYLSTDPLAWLCIICR